MDDVIVYAEGLVSASVCAASTVTREELERAVNATHPTGISSRWSISEDTTFADGTPMPGPCDAEPDRRHWLVTC